MTVRWPMATGLLLAALLAVRLAMDLAGVPTEDGALVAAGARDTGRILGGEAWRLVSSTMMHGSWKHLAFNAAALVGLGSLLEGALGPARLVLVFLGTAAAGHLVSMARVPHEVSLGASGGVYGLCGTLLAMLLRGVPPFTEGRRSTGAMLLLALGVALGLVHGFTTPDVDGFAHLGGLGAGLAVGAVLPGPRSVVAPPGVAP